MTTLTTPLHTQPRFLPAGEYRADQVTVGSHVLYGSRDVGRVNRIEELFAAFRDQRNVQRIGPPILKFEIACGGGRLYYVVRFPHEPVAVVEV